MSFPSQDLSAEPKSMQDVGTALDPTNAEASIDHEYSHGFEELQKLRQGLHQRHIQMIALAGTIGIGLFLSSGKAIATSGPLGAFLAYTIVGAALYSVVLVVGEMGALLPLSGGIIRYADHFVDPALAFANGWNEVYNRLLSIPSEIVSAAVIIEFWVHVNNAAWITLFGVVMLATALFFVRVYGEIEFAFATLKIALVIGINIMVCFRHSQGYIGD
jgi:yeast amino acid transporter